MSAVSQQTVTVNPLIALDKISVRIDDRDILKNVDFAFKYSNLEGCFRCWKQAEKSIRSTNIAQINSVGRVQVFIPIR